jgi:hypothetical protein
MDQFAPASLLSLVSFYSYSWLSPLLAATPSLLPRSNCSFFPTTINCSVALTYDDRGYIFIGSANKKAIQKHLHVSPSCSNAVSSFLLSICRTRHAIPAQSVRRQPSPPATPIAPCICLAGKLQGGRSENLTGTKGSGTAHAGIKH